MNATSLATLRWDDPLLLDDLLTDEERAIRDVAHGYAQEKLLPRVIEAFREEKTDRAIFNEMGELGLLGVTLPDDYGCAGASYVAHGLVAREGAVGLTAPKITASCRSARPPPAW